MGFERVFGKMETLPILKTDSHFVYGLGIFFVHEQSKFSLSSPCAFRAEIKPTIVSYDSPYSTCFYAMASQGVILQLHFICISPNLFLLILHKVRKRYCSMHEQPFSSKLQKEYLIEAMQIDNNNNNNYYYYYEYYNNNNNNNRFLFSAFSHSSMVKADLH